MHSLQCARARDTDAGSNATESRQGPSECSALPATVVLSEYGQERLMHRLKTITSERDEAQRQLGRFQERQLLESDINEIMKKQFSAFHRQLSDASLFVIGEVKASLSSELKNVLSNPDVGVIRQIDHLKALLNSSAEVVSTVLRSIQDLKAGINLDRPHRVVEETRLSVDPVLRMIQDHQLEVDRHFSHVCDLIRGVSPQEAVVASFDEVIKVVRALSDNNRESVESYASRVKIESDALSRIRTIEASVNSLHDAMRTHTSTLSAGVSKVQDGIIDQKMIEASVNSLHDAFSKAHDGINDQTISAHRIALEEAIRSLNAQIGQEFTKLQASMYHEMHIAIKKNGERVNDEIQDAIQQHNEQFMDRFVWLHETLLKKHSDMSEAMQAHNGQTRLQYNHAQFATVIDAIRKHIEQVLQKLGEMSRQKDEARSAEEAQVLSPEFDKMYEALERQNERMVGGFARLNEVLATQNHNAVLEIAADALSSVESRKSDYSNLSAQLDRMTEKLDRINDDIALGTQEKEKAGKLRTKSDAVSRDVHSLHDIEERVERVVSGLLREYVPEKIVLERIQQTLESVKEGIDEIRESCDDVDGLPDISSSPANNTQARKSVAFQELKCMQHLQTADIKNQIAEMKMLFQPEMLRKSIAPVMIDLLGEATRTCHQCSCETRNAIWGDGHWYCQQCSDEWVNENPGGSKEQASLRRVDDQEASRRKRTIAFDSAAASSDSDYEESLRRSSGEMENIEVLDLIGMQADEHS